MTDQQKTLIDFLANQPLEEIEKVLDQAIQSPEDTAKLLTLSGVQPIENGGAVVALSDWFNGHADDLKTLKTLVGEIRELVDTMPDEDLAVVRRVVEMQASHEAYYGMANLYALIDARREARLKDQDKPEIGTLAFRLQKTLDAMPEDLRDQTKSYLTANLKPMKMAV